MNKQGGYKQTEIGRLPKEWEVVRLEEIFDIQVGGDIYKLNFSKQKNERYKFPIYSNSLENNGLYGYADTYQYPENCITVTGRGTLGRATPRFEKFNAIIRLLVLIPKANINIMFASEYINTRIGFRIEKTSIPQLTAPKLAKYKIPLPPLPEQKKIAEILSTVDEAIEKVDESIARTERLKKGLMQELLTKGIGHKEFKDTEIGRIPKEWEVVRIKDIGEVFTGKTPSTSKDSYWNGDIPFITPEDMTGEKYVYRTNRYVSFEGANQSGKILPPNTVLVVCIGSTVGKVALTHKESVTNQQINSVLCKEKVDHDCVYYAISHRSYMLKNYSGVAAVPIVKKSLFEEFKIPLPQKIAEQQKIAEILSTVDKRLELLRNKKEKMEGIKKGLMNDLLTGKRRVKV